MQNSKENPAAVAAADRDSVSIGWGAIYEQNNEATRERQVFLLMRDFHVAPSIAAVLAALAFGEVRHAS